MPVLTFTQLEQAVLDAICDRYRTLPVLPAFLKDAVVLSRRNTGHGFYTAFRSSTVDTNLLGPQPISGPDARMLGMGEDAEMGFLLWCSTDKPSKLEGFQYGDTVDLKTRDLTELRSAEFGWT